MKTKELAKEVKAENGKVAKAKPKTPKIYQVSEVKINAAIQAIGMMSFNLPTHQRLQEIITNLTKE